MSARNHCDILLSHAYFLADDAHEQDVMMPYPPLGLLYVSAWLKREGFAVDVHDATFSTPEALVAHLEKARPRVLGLYVTLLTRRRALEAIQAAKRLGCAVVLGGPEPASHADEYLQRGADVVVIGEGEQALTDLIPLLAEGADERLAEVPGIVFRSADGAAVTTAPRPLLSDLDSLPQPDRDAVDMDEYLRTWKRHHGFSTVSLITARGCPFTCSWCSHSVFGHSHRRRSVERVADEVEDLRDRYDPDRLWYADDVFTIHRRWTLQFASELESRGIRIPFECISRADRLDEAVVDALRDMGCARLWIGAESGSQRILDAMKRRTDAEDVIAKTHLLQSRGIQVGMFIMLGYEGEQTEDIEATARFLKRAAPDTFLTTVAYPIQGTQYQQAVSDRIVAPGPWEATTDRDLMVLGRRSQRYYEQATRWLVNDVNLHLARTRGDSNLLRRSRMAASSVIGRIGMRLCRNEVESGPRPSGRGWGRHEAGARRIT